MDMLNGYQTMKPFMGWPTDAAIECAHTELMPFSMHILYLCL